ncbi:hypothetical protein MTO96_016408 [Rhipicephalus appendiculatus]
MRVPHQLGFRKASAVLGSACRPKPAQFFRGRKRRSTLTRCALCWSRDGARRARVLGAHRGAWGTEGVAVVVASAATAFASSSSAASCSGVNGIVAGTSSQQVALAELPTVDQLKAMGLCDTLIILSDASQGAQPVSLVSSLEADETQQSTYESSFDANRVHHCHCLCHDYSAMLAQNSQVLKPVQCLDGTAEAMARSGANLVLCLPDESLSLEVGASVQEVPGGWTWVQDPTSAAAAVAAAGDATALVRAMMDSSPVEDSVGLAAKSWFNDSVIATQALLTLEGHK